MILGYSLGPLTMASSSWMGTPPDNFVRTAIPRLAFLLHCTHPFIVGEAAPETR